jgi:hypothetical protein
LRASSDCKRLTKHENEDAQGIIARSENVCDRPLAGDTSRSATSDEVKALRKESRDLKEALADRTLENRLLKKSMIGHGGDEE